MKKHVKKLIILLVVFAVFICFSILKYNRDLDERLSSLIYLDDSYMYEAEYKEVKNIPINGDVESDEFTSYLIKDSENAEKIFTQYVLNESLKSEYDAAFFSENDIIMICYRGSKDQNFKVDKISVEEGIATVDLENEDEVALLIDEIRAVLIELDKDEIPEGTVIKVQ